MGYIALTPERLNHLLSDLENTHIDGESHTVVVIETPYGLLLIDEAPNAEPVVAVNHQVSRPMGFYFDYVMVDDREALGVDERRFWLQAAKSTTVGGIRPISVIHEGWMRDPKDGRVFTV